MGLFTWLEESGLAEWVRMSSIGYPTVITLHAIGMAIMVGLCVIVDLRLLGKFEGVPYEALQRLLPGLVIFSDAKNHASMIEGKSWPPRLFISRANSSSERDSISFVTAP